MSDRDEQLETIWAYLHGELDEPARAGLEKSIVSDTQLKARVEALRAFDRDMRELMPATGWTEQELADRLLRAWEQAHPAYGSTPAGDRLGQPPGSLLPSQTMPRMKSFRRGVLALVATAAVALVVFMIIPFSSGPITWSEITITQEAQYRGADGANQPPRYSRQVLRDLSRDLKSSVNTHCSKLSRTLKWKLSARLQELAEGHIAVQVTAQPAHDTQSAREWNKQYDDADTLRAKLDELAEQIAGDLMGPEPVVE